MSEDCALPKMAGYFYPSDKLELDKYLSDFFKGEPLVNRKPVSLIVPHAGYIFSGEIAGKAFNILNHYKDDFDTIVVVGPSHHVLIDKPAVLNKDYILPNGKLKRDEILIEQLVKEDLVEINDEAHKKEHSVEVELPFICRINPNFKIVDIITGPYEQDSVTKLIDALFKIPRTLIIISSDLSHFNLYEKAKEIDKSTIKNVLALNEDDIQPDDACGSIGIRALIKVAKKYMLKPKVLGYCNSGDKTSNKLQVVGYASFGFFNS